jgi:PPIC-type PPIASE domain
MSVWTKWRLATIWAWRPLVIGLLRMMGSLRPVIQWGWRPAAVAAGFLGLVVGAYFLGRFATLPSAAAAGPGPQDSPASRSAPAKDSDYSRQVVAYIYGSIPITREDLGEYLIARQGAERLELMVNHRIIDMVCQKKGIVVTDAEVEATLAEDIKKMNIPTVKDFEKLLKKYQKTLYEYKEDVIRPQLGLTKLCRDRVQVTEEDLRNAFEAYHGEKVECQIIMWPKAEKNRVMTDIYTKIRDSAAQFDEAAKAQASPTLAAKAGHIDPFAHNTTGNEELERQAFSLQPGQISSVIDTPDGVVVLKCIKRIPAEKGVTLDDKERAKLEKEIIDRKVKIELTNVFKQMREQANPQLFLGKHGETEEDLLKHAREALMPGAGPALPTHAN